MCLGKRLHLDAVSGKDLVCVFEACVKQAADFRRTYFGCFGSLPSSRVGRLALGHNCVGDVHVCFVHFRVLCGVLPALAG